MAAVPESQQQYGSLLTIAGENAEAQGIAQNKQSEFLWLAIGDANDTYVQPSRTQTALVHELHRIAINSMTVSQPTADSVAVLKVEAVLPDNINDLVIREFAVVAEFNGAEYLHAVGNCARIYVPPPANNGNVSVPVIIEMYFAVTSVEAIVMIDTSTATATQNFVTDKIKETSKFSQYRTFKQKLNDVINPLDFGAVSKVETDNTAALNLALIAAEGKTLDLADGDFYFTGPLIVKSHTNVINGILRIKNGHANTVHVLTANDIEFNRVIFDGESAGVIKIAEGSHNIRIVNCSFMEKLNQVIWLWTCENISVEGCFFNKCGYGVIAQNGYSSNNVRVTNCNSHKQKNDFIEANSARVFCKNWIIANNTFEGRDDWHESGTESRFVGITQLYNLVIANNIVRNVRGDAAVHLEEAGGSVLINGNVFENCQGNSWIYLLHSAKDAVISGNFFLRSDTRSNHFVISTLSDNYSNTVLINANTFLDSTGEKKMVPVYNGFQQAPILFSNNIIENCRAAVYIVSSNQMTISANVTKNCMYGVVSNATVNDDGTITRATSGIAGYSIIVTNNLFDCGFVSIFSTANENGTNGPKHWLITGNIVNKDIRLLNWSGASGQAAFNVCENNLLLNNAVADVAGKISKDVNGNFLGY